MRTHTPRGILAATVISLALVVTACGGGSDSDDGASADDTTTTTVAQNTATPGNPDTSLPSGEQVCTKIPADVVSDKLGLEVTTASPSDPAADQAPTCTYATTGGGGEAVTVAVLRPLDMNGNAGSEGFKSYVEINKAIAEGVEFDEVQVDVGRQAVRFTGTTTHAAIADTGTQVVSVVVPKDAASGEQVDALLGAVVTAIG